MEATGHLEGGSWEKHSLLLPLCRTKGRGRHRLIIFVEHYQVVAQHHLCVGNRKQRTKRRWSERNRETQSGLRFHSLSRPFPVTPFSCPRAAKGQAPSDRKSQYPPRPNNRRVLRGGPRLSTGFLEIVCICLPKCVDPSPGLTERQRVVSGR